MNKNNIIITLCILCIIMATHVSHGMSSLMSKSSSRQSVEGPKEQKIMTECLDANSNHNKEMKKVAQAVLLPDLWKLVCQYYEPCKEATTPEERELEYYKTLETPVEKEGYLWSNTYKQAASLTFTKTKDKLILDVSSPFARAFAARALGNYSKQPWIIWTIKSGFCNVGSSVKMLFSNSSTALPYDASGSTQFIKTSSDDGLLQATLISNSDPQDLIERIPKHVVNLHINKVVWLKSVIPTQSTQTITQSQPSSSNK